MKRPIRFWTMTAPMVSAHPAVPYKVPTEYVWQAVFTRKFLASTKITNVVSNPRGAIGVPEDIFRKDLRRSVPATFWCSL